MTARITYCTWHPDLDESLILDLLEGFVYVNDRQVIHKDIGRYPNDRKWPRTLLRAEEISHVPDPFKQKQRDPSDADGARPEAIQAAGGA